jgi:hypothetical protein
MTNTQTHTADEYRQMAKDCYKRSAESFERCDTDGFLSQQANDTMARVYELAADLIDNGERAMFLALFDTDGDQVPAKRIKTRYGMSWGLINPDDPNGRFLGWFNPSKAGKPGAARLADAKKGYYVGYVLAPAKADVSSSGRGAIAVRTDGGYSADAEIVDNGHGDTDIHRWYDIQDNTF